MIVNTKKGGAFKLFFNNSKKVVYDAGLQIKYKNKKYTSALLSEKNVYAVDESMVRVMGNLGKIKTQVMTPVRNVLSREFQTFLGRFQAVAALTKKMLRKILITFNKASKYKFTRNNLR